MIESNDKLEVLEELLDYKIAKKAYDEYIANGKQSRPIEELWAELDLLDIKE